jgi:hypothetical protein
MTLLSEVLLEPVESYVRQVDTERRSLLSQQELLSPDDFLHMQGFGDLLPQFSTPEKAKEYILKLFQANETKYQEHTDFILQNPYLLWQIPETTYALSTWHQIRNGKLNDRMMAIFKHLQLRLNAIPEDEWSSKTLQNSINDVISNSTLRGEGDSDIRHVVYGTLRFALTGDHERHSKPAKTVLALLGKEQSLVRLAVSRRVLESVAPGDWIARV